MKGNFWAWLLNKLFITHIIQNMINWFKRSYKHKIYCTNCFHKKFCENPAKCPMGNFDEYDK